MSKRERTSLEDRSPETSEKKPLSALSYLQGWWEHAEEGGIPPSAVMNEKKQSPWKRIDTATDLMKCPMRGQEMCCFSTHYYYLFIYMYCLFTFESKDIWYRQKVFISSEKWAGKRCSGHPNTDHSGLLCFGSKHSPVRGRERGRGASCQPAV